MTYSLKISNIVKQILKEDAFKDYKDNLARYDPDYITKTKDPNYAAMNKINSVLLNSYKSLPDEAKYQAAVLYKQWYIKNFPEKAAKVKQWNPDDNSQLADFNGVGIKGVNSTV